jgi:poly-gamma-glutamate biosynthesis protein PgsC/CapC
MHELLPLAIGIGLAVNLVFSELFGLAAGGMIVPGYLALSLTHPLDVVTTIGAGFVTYAIVHTLSSFIIVYGRRRTVLMILVGYLVGMAFRWGAGWLGTIDVQMQVVGFIIPGLIAIWFERQGIVETLGALLTASVVVRLVLILFVGQELLP